MIVGLAGLAAIKTFPFLNESESDSEPREEGKVDEGTNLWALLPYESQPRKDIKGFCRCTSQRPWVMHGTDSNWSPGHAQGALSGSWTAPHVP